jgi:hypothetical protein
MPRTAGIQIASALDQLWKLTGQLLAKLGNEIRSKERDLRRLKEAESKLVALTGQRRIRRKRAAQRISGPIKRIDWRVILEKLPRQFRASDIRTVGAVKDKRRSELFSAITRWVEAGTVKRKERGLYERVK